MNRLTRDLLLGVVCFLYHNIIIYGQLSEIPKFKYKFIVDYEMKAFGLLVLNNGSSTEMTNVRQ